MRLRWEALVNAKVTMLNELSTWSTENFQEKPVEGWSASQVMEHLLSAEMGTLGYIKKKSSSGWDSLAVTGEAEIKNSRAVNERLVSPERYQAPSILPQPVNELSLQQLKQNWQALRLDMEQFLETIDPIHYDKLVFKQPIAGMLNILQALEFMTHHLQHHIPQLHRIKTMIPS